MATHQSRSPTPPRLTNHADARWSERAVDEDGVDPWTAWIDGEPVELPEPWGDLGDEARFHPGAQVVLCRRDTALTTVYDLTGSDAHPHVRRAVEQQLDVSLEASR